MAKGSMHKQGNMKPGASVSRGATGNPMGGKNVKETPVRKPSRGRNEVPHAG